MLKKLNILSILFTGIFLLLLGIKISGFFVKKPWVAPSHSMADNTTEDSISLAEAVVYKEIGEGRFVEPGRAFFNNAKSLVCYTRVQGVRYLTSREVLYAWFWKNKKVQEQMVEVAFPTGESISRLALDSTMLGDWSVDVLLPDNRILGTLTFKIMSIPPKQKRRAA